MSFLEVEAVSVSYGKVRVLHDVTFQVEQGQIVTVIGANGAGKTTLINAVSGIVNHSGAIRFDGRALPKTAAKTAVAGIIQVPEGRRVFANLTVEENLILGGFGTPDKTQQKADIERMYELYPVLAERRRQAAGSLSGGEQQMLAISRGLMSHPKLLMLDEPSLGLAPLIVKDVFALIKQLNADGVTILLVEQ
ncbi:MAG TPA: ABC transporter ATP-binding protein, partial [Firmicutes bacterium]|nr:ABC transporter ATP-binding protein [Bacillota bacterium]